MSAAWVSGIAAAYAAGVVGFHRYRVLRQRAEAGGFPTLGRLDWDTLLSGLLPEHASEVREAPGPEEGGPAPALLQFAPTPATQARYDALCALVSGVPLSSQAIDSAGFSGGEARWLSTLVRARHEPSKTLDDLESVPAATLAEVYLREHLFLRTQVGVLNLEWAVFHSKRRLLGALRRFKDAAPLYFVRARASSLLGFNRMALDDLGRAVYFSRQTPFYLRAVLDTPYVHEARPVLVQQCRQALS